MKIRTHTVQRHFQTSILRFSLLQCHHVCCALAAKEVVQQPPGFSAISEWLAKDDFQSPSTCDAARAALQGLSESDRRYAVAKLGLGRRPELHSFGGEYPHYGGLQTPI